MKNRVYQFGEHVSLDGSTDDEQLVVVDGRTGSMWISNFSARPILDRLRTGATKTQLVEELIQSFGLIRSRAESDVYKFLDALSAAGLVEVCHTESVR